LNRVYLLLPIVLMVNDESLSQKIGYFCSYTPLEILHAAGLTPVRIIGHSNPIQEGDNYMHPNLCQYVRSCIDAAVLGQYEDLEGLVFVNSCDAMRRLADVWNQYVPVNFSTMLDLPMGEANIDVEYYREELAKLKQSLEQHFVVTITDQMLQQAGEMYNAARDLYHQVNALRRETPPRIRGQEMMQLANRFFTQRPEDWIEETKTLLQEKDTTDGVPEESQISETRPRILLAGSPIHDPEIVGFIEECGFAVVGEELCSGERFFDLNVPIEPDMLATLSKTYLTKPPCARMMNIEKRVERIVHQAQDLNAAGIIHHTLKFCDTYAYDLPVLQDLLADADLKILSIEGDCTLGSMSQLRTRLEAFREVLESS